MTALPLILRVVETAGHAVFTTGELNLNLVGVRSPTQVSDQFDDRLHAVWRDFRGEWVERSWRITTDPGAYYLQHPMRSDGTAILAPGQYRGAYIVGRHKGYPALQQDRPVMVFRDGNADAHLDYTKLQPAPASSRINIHAADLDPFDSTDRERAGVGRWSAGCQVFARADDYRQFWKLVERSAARFGPRFTYTLVHA